MKMVLVGAIGVLVVEVLLVMGAYMMRTTPEVINCDRGRQSATVRISATFPDPGPDIVRRELGGCNLSPKHGSWLNMAEIEPSVLSRQCLDRRVPDFETLEAEVAAWQERRDEKSSKID